MVVMDEIVKSIDALTRDQLHLLVVRIGLGGLMVPVLLPGSQVRRVPLAPEVAEEDRKQVEAVATLMNFLSGAPLQAMAHCGAAAIGARSPTFIGSSVDLVFAGGSVQALLNPAASNLLPLLPQV
jgi:hypothetical protein